MPTTVQLTLPTQNTDGSAVAAGEITDVQVGFGTVSGTYTLVATDTSFGAQTGGGGVVTIPFASLNETLAPGTWFAAARVDAGTTTSGWSNEVSFVIAPPPPPVPNPPTGFTVA
jgi:hypothetical protein